MVGIPRPWLLRSLVRFAVGWSLVSGCQVVCGDGLPQFYNLSAGCSLRLAATSNPTAAAYSSTALPDGLWLDADTGAIAGTVGATGNYTFVVNATDSQGVVSGTPFQLAVATPPAGAPAITNAQDITLTAGAPFAFQIAAINSPTGFTVGNLPAGLSASASGVISGVPADAGIFNLQLTAANAAGVSKAIMVLRVRANTASTGRTFYFAPAANGGGNSNSGLSRAAPLNSDDLANAYAKLQIAGDVTGAYFQAGDSILFLGGVTHRLNYPFWIQRGPHIGVPNAGDSVKQNYTNRAGVAITGRWNDAALNFWNTSNVSNLNPPSVANPLTLGSYTTDGSDPALRRATLQWYYVAPNKRTIPIVDIRNISGVVVRDLIVDGNSNHGSSNYYGGRTASDPTGATDRYHAMAWNGSAYQSVSQSPRILSAKGDGIAARALTISLDNAAPAAYLPGRYYRITNCVFKNYTIGAGVTCGSVPSVDAAARPDGNMFDVEVTASVFDNCLYNGYFGPAGGSASGTGAQRDTIGRIVGISFRGCTFSNTRGADDAFIPGLGVTKVDFNCGQGFQAGGLNTLLMEYCSFENNGASHGGQSVGMMVYGTTRGVVQYCESYGSRGSAWDGDGFDLDGGVRDCVFRFNYSHNNGGAGFQLAQYGGATSSWGELANNRVHHNISENDGLQRYGNLHLWAENSGEVVTNNLIYNNTFHSAAYPAVDADLNGSSVSSGNALANNLFFKTGSQLGHSTFVQEDTGSLAPAAIRLAGNLYYSTTGSATWRNAGATYSSLASWRGASGQETWNSVATGIYADPRLLSVPGGDSVAGVYQLATLNRFLPRSDSPALAGGINQPGLFSSPPGLDWRGFLIPAANTTFGALLGAPPAPLTAPAFSPAGGTFADAQSVALSTTSPGASIRYTTDGSLPTRDTGTLYAGPFTVALTATIQALAYQSGATDSPVTTATYTILSPYQIWFSGYGLPINGAGDGAGSADPDSDGLPNLLEYALGGVPTSALSAPNPTAQISDFHLQITFLRARGDVNYIIQGTGDLITWSDLVTNPGAVGESVTFTDTVNLFTGTKRFLRLKVTRP